MSRNMLQSNQPPPPTGQGCGAAPPPIPCHLRPYEPPEDRDRSVPVIDIRADIRWELWGQYQVWYLEWRERKFWEEKKVKLESLSGLAKTITVDVVNRRHLKELIQLESEINVTMVQEFYAKLAGNLDIPDQVTIRGVELTFTDDQFRAILGLPECDVYTYRQFEQDSTDSEHQTTCRYLFEDGDPLRGWPSKPHGGDLKPEFECLNHLVNMWLYPTSNKNDMHIYRYTMLDRLASNKDLNVAECIRHRMFSVATDNMSYLLMPYPGLLTTWFTNNNVPKLNGDLIVPKSKKMIDYEAIKRKANTLKKRIRCASTSAQDEMPEFIEEQALPVAPPFVPTYQQYSRDYAFASSQMQMMQGIHSMMGAMNLTPTLFHYHGYPFDGFYEEYPHLFSEQSTNYIPERHVPYFQRYWPGQQGQRQPAAEGTESGVGDEGMPGASTYYVDSGSGGDGLAGGSGGDQMDSMQLGEPSIFRVGEP